MTTAIKEKVESMETDIADQKKRSIVPYMKLTTKSFLSVPEQKKTEIEDHDNKSKDSTCHKHQELCGEEETPTTPCISLRNLSVFIAHLQSCYLLLGAEQDEVLLRFHSSLLTSPTTVS